jgi:hypothetical protein
MNLLSHLLPNLSNIVPFWNLHFILEMFAQRSKLKLTFYNRLIDVATLALGSRPRQGLARLRAKKEARESHLVLPRVQKSVRAWTLALPSELPFWELESQWALESSESDFRGQNPSVRRVFYIIGKLLEIKCLKWAFMTHLHIRSTSYGQKKGQKSN